MNGLWVGDGWIAYENVRMWKRGVNPLPAGPAVSRLPVFTPAIVLNGDILKYLKFARNTTKHDPNFFNSYTYKARL